MNTCLVLWIVGTAVAASPDDPRLAAATDGRRVWVTQDGGSSWRPLPLALAEAAGEEDEGDGDDALVDDPGGAEGEEDDVRPAVRALAFLDDHLLVATAEGLLRDGLVVCRLAIDALSVEGAVVYAAAEGSLWRSDDAGRSFHLAGALSDRVTSLAVSGDRILTAGLDLAVRAVAAAPDGTLFRATAAGVERTHVASGPAGEWRRVATVSARALAVGAADVWLATGHRVVRLSEIEAWERRRPPLAPVPFDPGGSAHRAGWAGLLPEVSLLARVAEDLEPGPREHVVALTLSWSLDDPEPSIRRTAAELLRRRSP